MWSSADASKMAAANHMDTAKLPSSTSLGVHQWRQNAPSVLEKTMDAQKLMQHQSMDTQKLLMQSSSANMQMSIASTDSNKLSAANLMDNNLFEIFNHNGW